MNVVNAWFMVVLATKSRWVFTSRCHESLVLGFLPYLIVTPVMSIALLSIMSLSSVQDSPSQAKYQSTLRNLVMTCAHKTTRMNTDHTTALTLWLPASVKNICCLFTAVNYTSFSTLVLSWHRSSLVLGAGYLVNILILEFLCCHFCAIPLS